MKPCPTILAIFITSERFTMEAIEITTGVLLTLFFTGLVAGFVDSIAGGGGLVALPMLISVGLPPHIALGTNKLQGTFGTLSASYNFIRKGEVEFKKTLAGIFFTFIGAAAGTTAVQMLNPGFIRHLIPVLLAVVLIYTLLSKNLGYGEHEPKMPPLPFFLIFGYTRVMNFVSNIVSLAVFIVGGHVLFKIGICMGAGQLIGARIGSNMAITRGAGFIRPVFMTVVALTISRLIFINYLS